MKKILLNLYKEMATTSRIKENYDSFLSSDFHKFMANRYDLNLIGE